MKKTLLIAAAATLSLSLNSVLYAGDIEKAERYSAPLEQQTVVDMDVRATSTGYVDVFVYSAKELGGVHMGLAVTEIQELGIRVVDAQGGGGPF